MTYDKKTSNLPFIGEYIVPVLIGATTIIMCAGLIYKSFDNINQYLKNDVLQTERQINSSELESTIENTNLDSLNQK